MKNTILLVLVVLFLSNILFNLALSHEGENDNHDRVNEVIHDKTVEDYSQDYLSTIKSKGNNRDGIIFIILMLLPFILTWFIYLNNTKSQK